MGAVGYSPFGLTSIVTSAMRSSFFSCKMMHEPASQPSGMPSQEIAIGDGRDSRQFGSAVALGAVRLAEAKLCAVCS